MTVCRRCGASNPPENKFCGQCGQQLISAPSAPTPDHDVPPWLREGATQPERAENAATQPSSTTADLPAWLADIGLEDDAPRPSEIAQAPDWLTQLQQSSPPASANQDADLPAWLRTSDVAERPADAAPPTQASAEQAPLPEWLRELETEPHEPPLSAAPAETPELPDWLKEIGVPDAAPAPQQPASQPSASWTQELETPADAPAQGGSVTADMQSDELPPWLRGDHDQSSTASSSTTPPSHELPSWLQEPAPAEASEQEIFLPVPDWSTEFGTDASSAESEDPQLPAWLSGTETSPAEASSTPQASEAKLPDWLNEHVPTSAEAITPASGASSDIRAWLLEESPTAAEAVESSSIAESESSSPAPAEVPAWLLDATAEEPPAIQAADTQSVPAWLRAEQTSSDEQAAPEAASRVDSAATEALPAWLLDHESGSSEEDQAPLPAAPSATDDLPPWLQAVDEPAPSASAQGLPDWLALPDQPESDSSGAHVYEAPAETEPSSRQTDAAPVSDATTAPTTAASREDELPPWLLAADEPVDTSAVAPTNKAPTSDRSAQTSADSFDLPSWLSGAGDEASATQTNAVTDADLPPWLSGLADEVSSDQTQSASPLPPWLDEPESTTAAASSKPEAELFGGLELPAWLREESDVSPAPAPVAQAAPAWLDHGSSESEEPTVAVTRVEAPPRPPVVRTPERRASAQLLEQLIDEPAAEPAPAPPTRRRSRVWLVLLVLLVLLIAGAVIFFLLNPGFGLSLGAAFNGIAGWIALLGSPL